MSEENKALVLRYFEEIALSDRSDGIVYDDENMTVGEYLDVWLKGSVYGSVRQSTHDRDTNLVKNHIKPILGGLKLKKLNSAHVQSFYRDRLDAGLGTSTVHKMHDILRRGLAQATKWHLVPRSVADTVKPPRPAPNEMHALSADEAHRLLEAAGGDSLEALYVLAIHTGMRQGELLALRWQDVDMENAVVSARRTLTRSGGKVVYGEPKTKKSRPVYPSHSAGRGGVEIAPRAPATGHGDPRGSLPGSRSRLHHRHGSADQSLEPQAA